jgi:tetratricopeptide (TPR) repeat protein
MKQDEFDSINLEAEKLVKKYSYDKALEKYNDILSKNPEHSGALIGSGNVLIKQHNYDDAIKKFQTVPVTAPEYVVALTGIGNALAGKRDYDRAIEKYLEAHSIEPDNVKVLIGWGDTLVKMHRYQEAIEKYGKAYETAQGSPDALICIVNVLSNINKKTSIGLFEKIRVEHEYDTNNFQVLIDLLKAFLTYDKMNVAEAIKSYCSAFEKEMNDSDMLFKTAEMFAESNNWDDARKFYEQALAIDDNHAESLVGIGFLYERSGDFKNAQRSYTRAADLDPCNEWTHYQIGLCLVKQKRYEEAIEAFDKAIKINAFFAEANNGKGYAFYEQGKLKEALEEFKKCQVIDKYFIKAYRNAGNILVRDVSFDEANTLFERAVTINPEYISGYMAWGSGLVAQRLFDSAVEKFIAAHKLDPDNLHYLINIADARKCQGQFEDAIRYCISAMQKNKDFPYAYFIKGQCHWAMGDYSVARESWETAAGLFRKMMHDKSGKPNAAFCHTYGFLLFNYLKRFEDAERVLLSGLDSSPDDLKILYDLVCMYIEWGNDVISSADVQKARLHMKAHEYFNKAVSILTARLTQSNNEDWIYLWQLGNFYLKIGDNDKAKEFLEKAVQKNDRMPETHTELGVVYFRLERYTDACKFFEKSHLIDQYDYNAWSNLAETYLRLSEKKLDKIRKAEAEYKKILKYVPLHLDSLVGLGAVYLAMAEVSEKIFFQKAVNCFQEALDLVNNGNGSRTLTRKQIVALHYSLGYVRLKMYIETRSTALLLAAYRDFSHCLHIDPDYFSARIARNNIIKSYGSVRHIIESVMSPVIILLSFFVFMVAQLGFIYGHKVNVVIYKMYMPLIHVSYPIQSVDATAYGTITIFSILLMVVGAYLPQIQKIKGGGIEIEMTPMSQISNFIVDINIESLHDAFSSVDSLNL